MFIFLIIIITTIIIISTSLAGHPFHGRVCVCSFFGGGGGGGGGFFPWILGGPFYICIANGFCGFFNKLFCVKILLWWASNYAQIDLCKYTTNHNTVNSNPVGTDFVVAHHPSGGRSGLPDDIITRLPFATCLQGWQCCGVCCLDDVASNSSFGIQNQGSYLLSLFIL